MTTTKPYVTQARHWAGLVLAAALGTTLLPGCGASAETPEVVGKRVGSVMCARYTQQNHLAYARDAQLATEIKTGKIKTKAESRARYIELSKALEKFNDVNRQTAVTDSLLASLDAAFPVKEDRLAVGRFIGQYIDQCEATEKEWQKTHPPTHVRRLQMRLPGPSPVEPYDPASGMPPPPPLPTDTTGY